MTELNVYVRSIEDRRVVETVPYKGALSQRALGVLEGRLRARLDETQHFVDTTEVDLALAKRRR